MLQDEQAVVWYLAKDGERRGPLTTQDMNALLAKGHVGPADLVWRDGFAEWRPAGTVFNLQPRSPPPVPPASSTARPPATPPLGPVQTPTKKKAAVSEPQANLGVAGYDISHRTGVVQSVQMMTKISSTSYGGGGTLQNGSGFIGAPNVNVTSTTTQRIFIADADADGSEFQIEAGDGFGVRPGNRLRVSYAKRGSRKPALGFVRNLDTRAGWRWNMNSVLPKFRWLVLIAIALGMFSVNAIATGIWHRGYWRPLDGVYLNRSGFARWLMEKLLPGDGLSEFSYLVAARINEATVLAFYIALGWIVARFVSRRRTRSKLWNAMGEND